jgi:hypothetical protein
VAGHLVVQKAGKVRQTEAVTALTAGHLVSQLTKVMT